MEWTKHERGPALAEELARILCNKMRVCVDVKIMKLYWNLVTDYVLELKMHVCLNETLLESSDWLCAGMHVCVDVKIMKLCWNLVTDYVLELKMHMCVDVKITCLC
jgi:hypothetical protein